MTIFNFILSLAIYLFVAFVLMYCTDEAHIWKDKKEIRLIKPSIHDLEGIDDKYILNKYIEDVLIHSHNYFSLRKRIETLQDKDSTEGCLTSITLELFSYLFVVRSAANMIPNGKFFDIPKPLYTILLFAITLGLCILGRFVIKKIYTNKLMIFSFDLDIEDLRERFVYEETKFGLNEEKAFNNYVILQHYDYLLSIEYTVEFRHNVYKIFSVVAGIIYFLFFMQAPD